MSPACVHGLPDYRYYDYDVRVGDALSAAMATNDKLRAKIAKLEEAGDALLARWGRCGEDIPIDGDYGLEKAWREAKA